MAPLGGISAGIGGGASPLDALKSLQQAAKPDAAGESAKGGLDFSAVLKDKLGALNAQQVDAGKASEDVATGRVDDIAQSMLRIEQANVSLQMATQVRNKVIESYQEILRMQM